MKIGFEFESGVSTDGGEAAPAPDAFSATKAEICLVGQHVRKAQNLKPGQKVTVTLRGTVEEMSLEAAEGSAGTTGELCLVVTEFTASRGSEFDDLLDD